MNQIIGIKIRSLSNTDLIEGDTIKMKCTVKLKSSHQLHLFENDNIQRRNQVKNRSAILAYICV